MPPSLLPEGVVVADPYAPLLVEIFQRKPDRTSPQQIINLIRLRSNGFVTAKASLVFLPRIAFYALILV
jgi:hypothetical protein